MGRIKRPQGVQSRQTCHSRNESRDPRQSGICMVGPIRVEETKANIAEDQVQLWVKYGMHIPKNIQESMPRNLKGKSEHTIN